MENYLMQIIWLLFYGMTAITFVSVALIITILFSYDEKLKLSNSKGFLLSAI